MIIEFGAVITLIIFSLLLVLLISFNASAKIVHWLTGLALAGAVYWQCLAFTQPALTLELVSFTSLTATLSQLALLIVLIVWYPLQSWLATNTKSAAQFYLLLLWLTIGALTIIVSNHFALFFIGLELLSLSLIGLIAFQCPGGGEIELGLEAAIKYLILSAVGSAVILLGFALLYISSGSLVFAQLSAEVNALLPPWLINLAIVLVLAGLLFKLSLVPCHLWFADLVQGSPNPVAALLSTISKLAVFVVVFKLFILTQWFKIPLIAQIITLVAILSMLVGNILALKQQNIYRLLAYSSIAHFGYLLIIISFSVTNESNQGFIISQEILVIYLCAYLLALTGVFSILNQIGNPQTLKQLQGLFWQQPLSAVVLMLMILSLAGIPLTFGFVAKFYLVISVVEQQAWLLLGALILGSVISLFYYFNLLICLTKQPIPQLPPQTTPQSSEQISAIPIATDQPRLLLNLLLLAIVLGLGLYPQPIAQLIGLL